MFCPNCGTKNPDDARFCAGCGKQLPQATSADAAEPPPASPPSITITCPGCGVGLEVDGSLAGQTGTCPNCGAAIEVPSAPPTPASAPDAPASAPTSISGAPSPGSAKDTRKPEEEKKPKSALRSYLAKQARDRPVQEIKPVSKVFLWCLAIGPFVAGMIAGPVAIVAFAVTALVFLVLDQRAIKKSGRSGDGALWYFLIFFIGFICIPVYLFCSGKDTKRGRTPGFVYLALLAVSIVVAFARSALLSDGNEETTPAGTSKYSGSASSIQSIFRHAKKAEAEGGVDFFGFYPGMSRADADALASHYGLSRSEWVPYGDPVFEMRFSYQAVRKIVGGGNTVSELQKAVVNRIGDFEREQHYWLHRTIDGHVVELNLAVLVWYGKLKKISDERAHREIREQSKTAVAELLSNLVPVPGTSGLLGKYEVTQAQWFAVMGEMNDDGADFPVETDYSRCQQFLTKLNAHPEVRKSGFMFSLPPKRVWTMACKAGSSGEYTRIVKNGVSREIDASSLDSVAWFGSFYGSGANARGSGGSAFSRVGGKLPNAFGFYDMCGNVREWVARTGEEETQAFGGDCYSDAEHCTASSARSEGNAGFRIFTLTKEEIAKMKAKAKATIIADMIAIPGRGYKMGKYEVTQAQWEAVMGNNPSVFEGEDNPVECVSWDDCQEFLKRLNDSPEAKKSGLMFRLPTEEEWETACRAGAKGKYSLLADGTEITEDTLGRVAWFEANSDEKPHPGGQKKPNAFGLYDMHGNVWEWTSTAVGENRILRGGGKSHSAGDCESSHRGPASPGDRFKDVGFRLCAETKEEKNVREAARRNARRGIISDMIAIPGRGYKMGKYEVTQAQWEAVMGNNPSKFKGKDNPVECVSWDDCQEFLKRLNDSPEAKKSGLTFRLPTEEEWETACRAGAKGKYSLLADGTEITEDTLGRVAWFEVNSDEKPHPGGQKKPNAFGLYDMHGNVWEWTSTADGEDRVSRGGCWGSSAGLCESSNRVGDSPVNRYDFLGFRLCASGKAD